MSTSIMINGFDDLERAGRFLMTAGVPKDEAGLRLAVGVGMGMSLMQCLNDIHMIKGRPTVGATVQLAQIRAKGVRHDWTETTPQRATLVLLIPGEDAPRSTTYTFEEAKAAALTGKDNWRNHPAAMLRARCITTAIRMWCPELLGVTVYDRDEVETYGAAAVPVAAPRTVPGLAPARQIEAPPPTVLDAQPAAPARIEVPEWAAACAGELLSPDQAGEVTGLLRAHGVPLAPVTKKHGEPHTWTGATVQAIVGRAAVWLAERAQRGAAQVVARGEPAAEQGGGEE